MDHRADAASYPAGYAELDWAFSIVFLVEIVLRVLRFFRELRTMLKQILGSFMALLWLLLLLLTMLFIFGIALMQGAASFLQSPRAAEVDAEIPRTLVAFFGTVVGTILTLFKVITGGLEWAEVHAAVKEVSAIQEVLFLCFVF